MNFSIRILQIGVLASILLLVGALSIFQLQQPQGVNTTIMIMQSVPLLILLPGLVRLRRRSFQWCGFVILLYFARSVVGVFLPACQWIDITMLLLSITIFILSLFASRWLMTQPTTLS